MAERSGCHPQDKVFVVFKNAEISLDFFVSFLGDAKKKKMYSELFYLGRD